MRISRSWNESVICCVYGLLFQTAGRCRAHFTIGTAQRRRAGGRPGLSLPTRRNPRLWTWRSGFAGSGLSVPLRGSGFHEARSQYRQFDVRG